MRNLLSLACSAGICLALALVAPTARAQTVSLIDTFGPSNSFTGAGSVSGTATVLNAVRFSVPTGPDVTIAHIDMALAAPGVPTVQIGVFNENAGLPVGMPIVSAIVPGPLTSALTFVSTTFSSTMPLLAGHNYWVAPFLSGPGQVTWGAGLTGSTSVAFFNGSAWATETPPGPLSIRVIAAPIVFPCCNARGTGGCIVMNPVDCTTIGGVPNPGVSTCAAAICSDFVPGACCSGVTCSATSTLGCIAASPNNRFLGAGTSCMPVYQGAPNPCCPADFNNVGGLSVQDIFDFLAAWFAGCP